MARFLDTDMDATAVAAVAAACRLRKVKVTQLTSDAPELYLQIWNTAQGSVTVGTTAPILVLRIPAGETQTIVAGQTGSQTPGKNTYMNYILVGASGAMPFSTALTMAVTTTPGGNTNPDAGDEPRIEADFSPGNV